MAASVSEPEFHINSDNGQACIVSGCAGGVWIGDNGTLNERSGME